MVTPFLLSATTFVENSLTTTVLSSEITIEPPDISDLKIATVKMVKSGGYEPGDRIELKDMYEGEDCQITVGERLQTDTEFMLKLRSTGNPTAADFQAVLKKLLFKVVGARAEDPSSQQRKVTFTVSSQAENGAIATSAASTVLVDVTPVNDPPEVSTEETTALKYLEKKDSNGIKVANVILKDVDSAALSFVTIKIDNKKTGDLLVLDDGTRQPVEMDSAGLMKITAKILKSYAGCGRTATKADFKCILDKVMFKSTLADDKPISEETREITIVAVDEADAPSAPLERKITIVQRPRISVHPTLTSSSLDPNDPFRYNLGA